VAELLIKNNADVNCQNSSKKNALMVACFTGNENVYKKIQDPVLNKMG